MSNLQPANTPASFPTDAAAGQASSAVSSVSSGITQTSARIARSQPGLFADDPFALSTALLSKNLNGALRYRALEKHGLSAAGVNKESYSPALIDTLMTTRFCIAGLDGHGRKVGMDLRNKAAFNKYTWGSVSKLMDRQRLNVLETNLFELRETTKSLLSALEGKEFGSPQEAAKALLAILPLELLSPSAFEFWVAQQRQIDPGFSLLHADSLKNTPIDSLQHLMDIALGIGEASERCVSRLSSEVFKAFNADTGHLRDQPLGREQPDHQTPNTQPTYRQRENWADPQDAWLHDEDKVFDVRQRQSDLFAPLRTVFDRIFHRTARDQQKNQAVMQSFGIRPLADLNRNNLSRNEIPDLEALSHFGSDEEVSPSAVIELPTPGIDLTNSVEVETVAVSSVSTEEPSPPSDIESIRIKQLDSKSVQRFDSLMRDIVNISKDGPLEPSAEMWVVSLLNLLDQQIEGMGAGRGIPNNPALLSQYRQVEFGRFMLRSSLSLHHRLSFGDILGFNNRITLDQRKSIRAAKPVSLELTGQALQPNRAKKNGRVQSNRLTAKKYDDHELSKLTEIKFPEKDAGDREGISKFLESVDSKIDDLGLKVTPENFSDLSKSVLPLREEIVKARRSVDSELYYHLNPMDTNEAFVRYLYNLPPAEIKAYSNEMSAGSAKKSGAFPKIKDVFGKIKFSATKFEGGSAKVEVPKPTVTVGLVALREFLRSADPVASGRPLETVPESEVDESPSRES